jgi:ring-1,2-phenylacetyl-CoA epoxidase subunit PaaD
MVNEQEIWTYLAEVVDPEIPVLSILDLGIVRSVDALDENWLITITPTYSGCPAMRVIENEIIEKLTTNGVQNVTIKQTLSPAWTTDWLSDVGKIKLSQYGIAPPENEIDKSVLFGKQPTIPCPQCASTDTRMVSQFGSTACKAHYQCNECLEPFDYFKCLK